MRSIQSKAYALTLVAGALFLGGCHHNYVANSVKKQEGTQYVFQEPVLVSRGYANISAQPSENPSQQRLMAIRASKIDAYRNMTEVVFGQNINSSTTLEDMMMTNDAVRARVEGVIYGARVVSITPVGSDSYETRLELDESQVDEIRKLFSVDG